MTVPLYWIVADGVVVMVSIVVSTDGVVLVLMGSAVVG